MSQPKSPPTKITVPLLRSLKGQRKISALTAYDYLFAEIINEAQVDLILVGDSLATAFAGKSNTITATIDQMVYHLQSVAPACTYSLLVGDLPFMTYQESNEVALRNAAYLLQEGGAEAVKLEGGENVAPRIEFLTKFDIPVVAHIGLLPQSYHLFGGHKKQGLKSSVIGREAILADAQAVAAAGAFAVVLECIPADLAKEITVELDIPTIGIGAGASDCTDGQIRVSPDLFGLTKTPPKFIKDQHDYRSDFLNTVKTYIKDI